MKNEELLTDTYNNDGDQYPDFEQVVADRFNWVIGLNEHLFTTNVDPQAMWDAYLNNLPAEAQQHYNCHACRHFIQRFGGLVFIDGVGDKHSAIWEETKTPAFFANSVRAMKELVQSATVNGVFIPENAVLGQPKTGEWTHLAVRLPKTRVHKNRIKTAHQVYAEKIHNFETLINAILSFEPATVDTAVQLLESDTLYRADKVMDKARWFQKVIKLRNQASTSERKRNVVYMMVALAPTGFTSIRSGSLGRLLEVIESGATYEAVKADFRKIMDPDNYQRSQSAPTATAIFNAEKFIEKHGLGESLDRRYATIEEIPEFLWQPKGQPKELAEKKSTGGVFSHLTPKQTSTTTASVTGQNIPAKLMTFEKFKNTVLPSADAIEVLVDNPNRIMAMVTANIPTAENILQWDNPFSWYYHGGVDASIRERLEEYGGRYEGNEIRASLIWEGLTDLDLHCISPTGEHIYYSTGSRRDRFGGYLDLDMNGMDKSSHKPVENIRWTNAPEGRYKFYVHNYQERENGRNGTPFRVELEINGQVYHYDGKALRNNQQVTVFEFDYRKGQQPNIQSAGVSSSAEDWTVETNKFVKVNGITTSPNLWGDKPVTHAGTHVFFLLDGVKDTSEGKGRGFFNEMLKSDLREIRKTLELYTASTPIKGAEEATACGVGYNKDTEWNLTVKVTSGGSSRLIKIDRWD
ncbi:hypothetical protein SP15_131 [Bacillus phage SP-15]|uniref:Uncharacterized protein n=1 Tax=Bacillus phage SP-15 TaxID=1792032 RepID=A0A127AW62_9CAUD|nr:hypothetical protein SP15_131 [Bacillus phage SP-15]AMM44929.1 hypothetical protein SP15_131 [Bacillus phage SP-15]